MKYVEQIKEIRNLDVTERIKLCHESLDDTPYKMDKLDYYDDYDKFKLIHHTKCCKGKKFKLLKVNDYSEKSIFELLKNRETKRNFFNSCEISLQDISNILGICCGVKSFKNGLYNQKTFPLRMSNSQGGFNHQDIYLFVNKIDGLDEGIYYYDFVNHELILIHSISYKYAMQEIGYMMNEYVAYSSFSLILVSNINRIKEKYKSRCYRYAHVDIGIMASNIQLYSESIGIGSVMIAGFLEHKVIEYCNLSDLEIPILLMSFGKNENNTHN